MEKFAHFALGVVWRAAIHDWTMPDGMILPRQAMGDFEPPIRNYLLGGKFPPNTSVIVIVCSDDQSRRIWYTPTILIETNCLNFRFLARCNSPRKCLFYGSAAHRMPEIMAVFVKLSKGEPTRHCSFGPILGFREDCGQYGHYSQKRIISVSAVTRAERPKVGRCELSRVADHSRLR